MQIGGYASYLKIGLKEETSVVPPPPSHGEDPIVHAANVLKHIMV